MTTEQRAKMIEAMVATSAQLARLLQRLHGLANSPKHHVDGKVDRHPHWGLRDLDPPSPLMDGHADMAMSGAISLVIGVQARLLARAASDDEIDALWVCRVLQALGDEFSATYSPLVQRMAAITGAELPAEPRGLHNGLRLSAFISPGEWRPPPPFRGIHGLGE